MIYKFTNNSNVPSEPPMTDSIFQLHDRLKHGAKLNREEKDQLVYAFHNSSSNGYAYYKRAGWCADFTEFFPRFLVHTEFYGWKEYYAPDKTSLRQAISSKVLEIIEIPKKN